MTHDLIQLSPTKGMDPQKIREMIWQKLLLALDKKDTKAFLRDGKLKCLVWNPEEEDYVKSTLVSNRLGCFYNEERNKISFNLQYAGTLDVAVHNRCVSKKEVLDTLRQLELAASRKNELAQQFELWLVAKLESEFSCQIREGSVSIKGPIKGLKCSALINWNWDIQGKYGSMEGEWKIMANPIYRKAFLEKLSNLDPRKELPAVRLSIESTEHEMTNEVDLE